MVANGHLETPSATVELQFKFGDNLLKEHFIVMINVTSPLFGHLFLQENSTVLDMHQGILNFPFFYMKLKRADNKYSNINELLLYPTDVSIQPAIQKIKSKHKFGQKLK